MKFSVSMVMLQSRQIMYLTREFMPSCTLFMEVTVSNNDVGLIPDLVLDQKVHVLMHLGEGGIRVHSVVIGTAIPIRAFTIDCRSFFYYVYRNLNFQQK